MKYLKTKFILILALFASLILMTAFDWIKSPQSILSYPRTWPYPHYDFNSNPISQSGIDLGRMLFYDPILSGDSTVSCSNCHFSYTAFTHVDHATSHGINDQIGRRNSPALMNLAWRTSFNWDGAVHNLDFQALAPISDSSEMGSSLDQVILRLKKTDHYPLLFEGVFGDEEISGERLLKSLAQFQLSLISANSKYDQYQEGLIDLTDQELAGLTIFETYCETCHSKPFFGGEGFANNGIGINDLQEDVGQMEISLLSEDSLKFRIPSLRNIKYSYPYMHDGRMEKLSQVIEHYNNITLKTGIDSRLPFEMDLSPNEKVQLQSFLMTLNDLEFIFNANHAYPRNLYRTFIENK